MTHYLLIHGSWHGGWCWHKIAPRLRAEGHSVAVPDLAGRARDRRSKLRISLGHMAAQIARSLPKDRKTIVVVHSRYGVLASALAQLAPDRIERTIYLAAYMLPTGARAADYFRADRGSLLRPYVSVNKLALCDSLSPEIYREGLYHDCSADDVALAHSLLCPEPVRPAMAKLRLSDDRYGRVPRAYIRLSEDRAVTPALQDRCLNETSVERVEELRASHSAYFSMPDQLVQAIQTLAKA